MDLPYFVSSTFFFFSRSKDFTFSWRMLNFMFSGVYGPSFMKNKYTLWALSKNMT